MFMCFINYHFNTYAIFCILTLLFIQRSRHAFKRKLLTNTVVKSLKFNMFEYVYYARPSMTYVTPRTANVNAIKVETKIIPIIGLNNKIIPKIIPRIFTIIDKPRN